MPDPLTDEEVQEIIDSYKKHGSYSGAAKELDRSTATIKKYVDEWEYEKKVESGEIDPTKEDPSMFTAEPPDGVEEDDTEELADMSFKEFIKWFFNQDGFGVRGSFANTLAATCEVRGKIPDKAEMANEILSGNSGISNAHQAERVAEVYWDAAQRFLSARGEVPGQSRHVVGGTWTDGNDDSGSGGDQSGGPGGSWVGTPESRAPSGQQNDGPSDGPYRGGWGGAPQSYPPQATGSDPQLADAIRELKETQMAILKNLSEDRRSKKDQKDAVSQIQEMVELQRTIKQLNPSDEKDELRKELAAMKKQLAQQAQQSQQPKDEDDLLALAKLASSGELDKEVFEMVASTRGVTDPEVKRAQFELEKTQQEMESRKELVNTVMDGIKGSGDGDSGVLGAAIKAFLSSRDEQKQQQATQPAQPNYPQQPQPQPQQAYQPQPGYGPAPNGTAQPGDPQQQQPQPQPRPEPVEDQGPPGRAMRESVGGDEDVDLGPELGAEVAEEMLNPDDDEDDDDDSAAEAAVVDE